MRSREAARFAFPPIAPRHRAELIGGVEFDDPYSWLEEESPEVLAWQRRQSEVTREYIQSWPHYRRLRDSLVPLCKEAYAFAPEHAGAHWFTRHIDEKGVGLAVSAGPIGPYAVIVHPSDYVADKATASLDWYFPSLDGRYVAFGVSELGDEQSVLRVMDVEERELLPGQFPFASECVVGWLPDSSGFYYDAGLQSDWEVVKKFVFFHALREADQRQPEPHLLPGRVHVQVSRDGRWVAMVSGYPGSGGSLRPQYLKSHPHGPWRPFLKDLDEMALGVFFKDSYIAITTLNAPRGRLVRVPLVGSSDPSAWSELVPEASGVMKTVELVGDKLVLCRFEDCFGRLDILESDGTLVKSVDLPGDGAVRTSSVVSHYQTAGLAGSNVVPGNEDFTFVFSTPTRSPAIYRFDLRSMDLEELRPPRFRGEDLIVESLTAEIDGRVPVRYRLVYARELDRSRPRPALMLGYGGFGVSLLPAYLGCAEAFVRAGGIFVMAHLRGGGEFGRDQWHDGRRHWKQHTYEDVYTVAEHLAKTGVSTSDQLAIVGGSGGGLMTASVLVQRPDLFRVVSSLVGLSDLMKFTRDPHTAECTREWGDPAIPSDAEVLYSHSPYHNVREAEFPATLILCGERDMRCWPWHSRKLAARVQSANRGPRPVLLSVHPGFGHLGTFTNPEKAAEWLGFTMRELGMSPAP